MRIDVTRTTGRMTTSTCWSISARPTRELSAVLAPGVARRQEPGRALGDLHMAGVAMNTTILDHALVEPRYAPVFAELDRRAAALYLHPAGDRACTPLIGDYHLTRTRRWVASTRSRNRAPWSTSALGCASTSWGAAGATRPPASEESC
jgi:hypothetical protein